MVDDFLAARSKYDDNYANILIQVDYLKLPLDKPEVLRQHRAVIIDKYAGMDHDAISRVLKSDEYVDRRVFEYQFAYNCKLCKKYLHVAALIKLEWKIFSVRV